MVDEHPHQKHHQLNSHCEYLNHKLKLDSHHQQKLNQDSKPPQFQEHFHKQKEHYSSSKPGQNNTLRQLIWVYKLDLLVVLLYCWNSCLLLYKYELVTCQMLSGCGDRIELTELI